MTAGASATAVTTFTITDPAPVVAPISPSTLDADRGPVVHGADRRLHRPEPDRAGERFLGHDQLGRHHDIVGHDLSACRRHVHRDRHAHVRRGHDGSARRTQITFTVQDVGGATLVERSGRDSHGGRRTADLTGRDDSGGRGDAVYRHARRHGDRLQPRRDDRRLHDRRPARHDRLGRRIDVRR